MGAFVTLVFVWHWRYIAQNRNVSTETIKEDQSFSESLCRTEEIKNWQNGNVSTELSKKTRALVTLEFVWYWRYLAQNRNVKKHRALVRVYMALKKLSTEKTETLAWRLSKKTRALVRVYMALTMTKRKRQHGHWDYQRKSINLRSHSIGLLPKTPLREHLLKSRHHIY